MSAQPDGKSVCSRSRSSPMMRKVPQGVSWTVSRSRRSGVGHQMSAEAGVGQAGAVGEIHPEDHVGPRAVRPIGGRHPADPRREPGDAEAERVECGGEEVVLFEAVSAARAVDDLGFEIGEVERDGAAEQRVEVFEWDGGDMRRLDPAERLQRRGQ